MSLRDLREFLRDSFGFLGERSRLWLLPLFVVLLVIGAFVVVAAGSAAAPFIYALF